MINEPTSTTRDGDEAGESPTGSDPASAGPHDPRAEEGGWLAGGNADRGRSDRVPDLDEVPAQTNPNAMAKAMLRKDQAY